MSNNTYCIKPIEHIEHSSSNSRTSSYLKENILNNVLHDPHDIYPLVVNAFQGGILFLDSKFLKECGLKDIHEINFDPYNESHGKLYENIKPICSICLREYLEKSGVTFKDNH